MLDYTNVKFEGFKEFWKLDFCWQPRLHAILGALILATAFLQPPGVAFELTRSSRQRIVACADCWYLTLLRIKSE